MAANKLGRSRAYSSNRSTSVQLPLVAFSKSMRKPSPQFSLARRVVFIARIVFLGTFVGAAFLVVALDNITNSASRVPRAESITSDDRLTPQAATFLVNTLA